MAATVRLLTSVLPLSLTFAARRSAEEPKTSFLLVLLRALSSMNV